MPVVRVYLPLGRADLEQLAATGALAAEADSPREAYAVTPALERSAPGLDVEDLEYSAFCDAVVAAGALRSSSGARRVVAAADVDPSVVVPPADGRGGVTTTTLTGPVPLRGIASFHVEDEDAVGEEADEMLWYDVTELDDVRGFIT